MRNIDEPGSRREGGGLPILRAGCGRADVAHGLPELRLLFRIEDGPAGLQVDRFGRIDGTIRIGRQHLPGRAIDHVEVAVPIGPDQHLARLPVHRHVEQDDLVDAVVIVLVMREGLIEPLRRAVIGISRENSSRPFIVARPLLMIPWTGIAGPIINQVEIGIVGDPTHTVPPPIIHACGGQVLTPRSWALSES